MHIAQNANSCAALSSFAGSMPIRKRSVAKVSMTLRPRSTMLKLHDGIGRRQPA